MRCTNWVATKQTERGPKIRFVSTGDSTDEIANKSMSQMSGKMFLGKPVRCGGHLKAIIKAVDEPYFGGHSASLDLYFQCDKCKTRAYDSRLPDEYTLADFLTKLMETWEPE